MSELFNSVTDPLTDSNIQMLPAQMLMPRELKWMMRMRAKSLRFQSGQIIIQCGHPTPSQLKIYMLAQSARNILKHKGNHFREEGFDIYLAIYSFVFSSFNDTCTFEKLLTAYQTLERVFDQDSKHREVSLKKPGCASFFSPLSRCLDILMKCSNLCLIYHII